MRNYRVTNDASTVAEDIDVLIDLTPEHAQGFQDNFDCMTSRRSSQTVAAAIASPETKTRRLDPSGEQVLLPDA